MHDIDVEGWEREIAEGEAEAIRETVRIAITSGRGSFAALQEVRRTMSRLTMAQRDIVVDTLMTLGDRVRR